MNGTASRGTVFAVLTSQTCGEACWHAREEICRCECGGRNHGCLRTSDGIRPVRSSKIDGASYELKAVGWGMEHQREAERLNHWSVIGFGGLDPVMQNGKCARLYYYQWRETDSGAPARLKPASKDQLSRWDELRGFTDPDKLRFHGVRLLWVRRDYSAFAEAASKRKSDLLSTANPWADKFQELLEQKSASDSKIISEITTLAALQSI